MEVLRYSASNAVMHTQRNNVRFYPELPHMLLVYLNNLSKLFMLQDLFGESPEAFSPVAGVF